MHTLFGLALLLTSLLATPVPAAADTADEPRRGQIAARGRTLFTNPANHCHAFRDLVAYAAERTANPAQMLEDLKFVLIGETLRTRGSGPHYIGNRPGARGDSGFKSELRDGSPQVEHALAAIYIGRNYPPGSTEAIALWAEIVRPAVSGQPVSAADTLLYAIGGDTGQRLSGSNYRELPRVIERTLCA